MLTRVAVHIDEAACERVAMILRSIAVPSDREDSQLAGLSRAEIGNFYLFTGCDLSPDFTCWAAAAPGQGRWGFEKGDGITSRRGSRVEAQKDRKVLSPDRWAILSGLEMAALFRDPEFGELLTEPEGRAALIRDLGSRMSANRWQSTDDLFAASHGRLDSGPVNLLALLQQFRAYRDPVRKKSLFFLALMREQQPVEV